MTVGIVWTCMTLHRAPNLRVCSPVFVFFRCESCSHSGGVHCLVFNSVNADIESLLWLS